MLGLQEPGSGAADVGRDTGSHSPTRTISMGDSWADEKVCRLSLRWHCQTQEMKNPARAKRSCGEKQETRWKGGRGHPAKGSSSRSVSPLASATIANRYTSMTTILVKKRAKGLKEGKRTVRRFMKKMPSATN